VRRGLEDGPGLFRSLDIVEQHAIRRSNHPCVDEAVEPNDPAPVGFAKESEGHGLYLAHLPQSQRLEQRVECAAPGEYHQGLRA
jgi:hypothetical protein